MAQTFSGLERSNPCGEMIELRLQRVQALAVDVDRLPDFTEQSLDLIEALIEHRIVIGLGPVALIERTRCGVRRGATATHGKGF